MRPLKAKPLPLKNDGQLSLFFTGVGSAFSKRHYQTNLIIIKGNDHLMVDCGTKTPQALFDLGISVLDINNYFVTHSHADHVGGLEEVMLLNRYVKGRKPNIIITETYQHLLWDMSLRGGTAFNEDHEGRNLTFGDMWSINRPQWLANYPRETFETDLGGLNIKIFRTNHTPGESPTWQTAFWSTGVILDNRVMFTSDTKFDRDLLEKYAVQFDLEMIFHDCQFMPPGGVHASIEELKTLDPKIKKKMVLVHYGDNWEEKESLVEKYGFHSLAKQWQFYDF